MARYLTELKSDQLELSDLLKLGALVGLPMVLVMVQPDLGTALTFVPILMVGVFLAGFRWQYAVAILVMAAVIAPVGYYFVLKDYQRTRLVTFLDPSQDPRGSGYQVIQSKIAVGSGALWGRGVTKGTQTQGRFLPVPHKDFIFSAFAEEHGFVGVIVVLGFVFPAAHADRAERPNGPGPGRDVYLHGRSGGIVVSRFGQCRDGGGEDAGHGHSAAADEFRRIEYFVGVLDAGAGE